MRRRRRLAILALCACAAPVHARQTDRTPDPRDAALALVGVHVISTEADVALEDRTVIVAGERIVAVGPRSTTAVPAGATVIEGNGRYLAPGLADMHVHLHGEADLVLFLANGVTTVRNLFGFPLHLELQRRIEAGELLGPTIHTAGPILDGQPPVWPGSDVARTAEEAERMVRAQAEAGYGFLKVYENLLPDAYDAIVETAAELGIQVHGHVPTAVGLDRALEARQRTIEHLSTYGPAMARSDVEPWRLAAPYRNMVHGWTALDPERVAFYAGFTRESETWNCPTLVVLARAFATEPELAAFRERTEALRFVPSSLSAYWNAGPRDEAVNATVQAGMPGRYAFLRTLHEAGARLLIGTDTPNPWVIPGFSIHEELAHFIAAGFTPRETLRMATAGAAEFLGLAAELGDVRPGLVADLVLLAENPLRDLGAYARPAGLVLRGRWLPGERLARDLEALAGR